MTTATTTPRAITTTRIVTAADVASATIPVVGVGVASSASTSRVHAGVAITPPTARWRVVPTSHVALARGRRSRATAESVLAGSFDVAPGGDTATVRVEMAGATLTGTGVRSSGSDTARTTWDITGRLVGPGRAERVTIRLTDHGVVRRSGDWWWLSGTGRFDDGTRGTRRRGGGSPVVVDLLLGR